MGRQRIPEDMINWLKIFSESGIVIASEYPPLPLLLNDEVIEAQPDQASLTARFVEQSVRFMRENRERPFFLYLAHIYVHRPIYAQERFVRQSRNGVYGAAVASIDWATGVLLAELRRLGIEEDTVVIFTSDNGSRDNGEGGSNAPLRGEKGTTWEGGLRVPCLVRWPGHVQPGTVSSVVATAMDLLPTLAAMAGADLPSDRIIDGRDITPVLEGRKTSPQEAFFYYQGNSLAAVRAGMWKLHTWRSGAPVDELYNLEEDIGESRNVFDQHGDVVTRLRALADGARRDLGDAAQRVIGRGVRSVGEVEEPVPLTTFEPDQPYYLEEYDLTDRG